MGKYFKEQLMWLKDQGHYNPANERHRYVQKAVEPKSVLYPQGGLWGQMPNTFTKIVLGISLKSMRK